jgi:hypothetical protein
VSARTRRYCAPGCCSLQCGSRALTRHLSASHPIPQHHGAVSTSRFNIHHVQLTMRAGEARVTWHRPAALRGSRRRHAHALRRARVRRQPQRVLGGQGGRHEAALRAAVSVRPHGKAPRQRFRAPRGSGTPRQTRARPAWVPSGSRGTLA